MSKQENSPEDRLDDLPKRIERLLEHLGIRNVELARRLGVSRSYVTNLRKGHHCSLPVLTLIEKLESDCFPPAVEARVVEMPVPPKPVVLTPMRGIGGFQSFPGGRMGGGEETRSPMFHPGNGNGHGHGNGNGNGNGKQVGMGNRVDLNQPLVQVENGEIHVPLLVGDPSMPREWQPAFLPLWRQYDVATRTLSELGEVAGAGGCLTTDVEDAQAFAMRVEGDEMAPMIFGGDSIVLSPKEPIRTGGVALARLREVDGGGVLLRQVMLTERGRVLGKEPGGGVRLDECVWVVAVWAVVRKL